MIRVEDVQHVGGLRLAMRFSDGTNGVADLSDELRRRAFTSLCDQAVFAKAYVADGTVCWPGGLDLAAERLYALAHSLRIPETLEEAEASAALRAALEEGRRSPFAPNFSLSNLFEQIDRTRGNGDA